MNIEVTRINQAVESDPAGFVQQVNSEYHFQLKTIADSIILLTVGSTIFPIDFASRASIFVL